MMPDVRERLRDTAAAYLRDARGAHRFDHTVRVVGNAQRLAASCPEVAWPLLEAAAWLHDVGRGLPESGVSHAITSATIAASLLPELGFLPAETELVVQAIGDHRFSTNAVPRSLLGKLLQDADRLDALGAIGIARTFAEGYDRDTYDLADPFARHRPADDQRYTVDHFFAKLLRLPGTLHTLEARAEAAARVRYMREFLAQLAHEIGEAASLGEAASVTCDQRACRVR